MPQRQKRAPWRAQSRVIHGAGRTVVSLSLPAIMLLAGPASAAAPSTSETRHASEAPKAVSARASSFGSHKDASATKDAKAPIKSPSEKTALANAILAAHAAETRREAGERHPTSPPNATASHHATTTARKATSALHKTTTSGKGGTQVAQGGHVPATTAPVRRIAREQQPSAQPTRVPLGVFMVTCYDLTGPTASGALAGPESVAVDPSVIALGTTIYVPGIGDRIADDTGGMIMGDHIDIWEPTYGQCADWGVRELPIYRAQ